MAWCALSGCFRAGGYIRAPPPTGERANPLLRLVAAVGKVAADLATEKRYRSCIEESHLPWYRSRWFMHGAIMWGFLGLAAATGVDYLLLMLAGKVPGQPEALCHPTRLLGTLAGLLVVFGIIRALVSRIKKPEKYSSHSLLSDWLFLWLLLGGDGYRLPGRGRTLPAARNRLGSCCLPGPRDPGHGDRSVISLYQVRSYRLPSHSSARQGIGSYMAGSRTLLSILRSLTPPLTRLPWCAIHRSMLISRFL